jgi:excisionase family DNA binding protein
MTSRPQSTSHSRSNQPQALSLKRLITVKELAEMLAVSSRHVYRLRDSGQLPVPVKLGRATRWDYTEICHWLESGAPSIAKGSRGAKGRKAMD